jgi:hypothetical protein
LHGGNPSSSRRGRCSGCRDSNSSVAAPPGGEGPLKQGGTPKWAMPPSRWSPPTNQPPALRSEGRGLDPSCTVAYHLHSPWWAVLMPHGHSAAAASCMGEAKSHKERWFGCHSAAMDVGTLQCVISHMTPTPYEQGATAIQGLCQHTLEGESRLSVVSIHPPSGVRPLYAA